MGKETVLPKNIRQIGDIRGREKICMEDYVMTYIRKKEPEEERGYLGIFLGEKKQTEDSDYILIRGILEIRGEDAVRMEDAKEKFEGKSSAEENRRKDDRKSASEEKERKNNGKNALEENGRKDDRKKASEEKERKDDRKSDSEENGRKDDRKNALEENKKNADGIDTEKETLAVSSETLAEKIQKERRLYFPEWEIQGCCVIGTYPAAKMEELAKAVPESCSLLYHLQEQEENFYWIKNGQYQRIRGYFVFYEQNKLMQEYMSEVFGSNSVEKESQPDRAIRNFREKIAQKSEKKSRSMLKLASSFFVVTVLVVGAVVVNRLDDIRSIQSLPPEISEYQAAEVVSSLNTVLDSSASTAADGGASISEEAAGSGAVKVNTVNSIISDTADGTPEQAADDLTDELAGSAAFWDEAYEDTAASADNIVSEHADDSSVTADCPTTQDTASVDSPISQDASVSTDFQNAQDASVSTDLQSTQDASVSTDLQSAQDASVSTDLQNARDASVSTDLQSTRDASVSSDLQTVQDTSVGTDLPAVQEASSMRQTYAAYVIKEGDTLADICSRYYGDLNHLEEICEVNEIEDANRIMPGQKIVLP